MKGKFLNTTTKQFIQYGALMMVLTVGFGAFGAHALKDALDENMLKVYKTGIEYQFYHTVGLFLVAFISHINDNKLIKTAGYVMIASIIIFSGSLYLLAITSIKWLGIITPIGGTGFIAAWILVFASVNEQDVNKTS